jgi:HEAT repeats
VRRTLKGDAGPEVTAIEMRDFPSVPAIFTANAHGVAFLEPARMNSYLTRTLPQGHYVQLDGGRTGWIAAGSAGEADEVAAIIARLVAASREPPADPGARAAAARALTLDEIAARPPALVEDGAAGLAGIPDLAATLTPAEQARLEAALARTDLPARVRAALVRVVGTSHLRQLAPTLAHLREPAPEVLAAAWEALVALDAAPQAADFEPYLTSREGAVRGAAVRGLIHATGVAGIPRATAMALDDPDPAVRRAAVEALGDGRHVEALPSLERVYVAGPNDLRLAAGRMIFAIGGRPAAESFARLAFAAPPDAQKHAVALLLSLGLPQDDELVAHIRETHPDPEIRDYIEHGLKEPSA